MIYFIKRFMMLQRLAYPAACMKLSRNHQKRSVTIIIYDAIKMIKEKDIPLVLGHHYSNIKHANQWRGVFKDKELFKNVTNP